MILSSYFTARCVDTQELDDFHIDGLDDKPRAEAEPDVRRRGDRSEDQAEIKSILRGAE